MRTLKPHDLSHHSRFHYGLEWEILNADAVVLLGLTHALRYGAMLSIRFFSKFKIPAANRTWVISSACEQMILVEIFGLHTKHLLGTL